MNKKPNLIRELPETERPYEKCEAYGPEVLSNAELLSVILKTGSKDASALDIAMKLLKTYECDHTLSDIFSASIEELTETPGIGRVKAITLMCVGELAKRISRESAYLKLTLSSPSSIASFYMETLRHLNQEMVRAAFFDTKNNLLKDVHISTGTVNASLVTPREVFLKALRYKAVYVVLVHNHPSGDPTPSGEDKILTKKIKDVGDALGIPLMDHIIIGDNTFTSFKEKGLL